MSVNILTESQIIALEAYARFGSEKPIQGAAEVLRILRQEVAPEIDAPNARALYEWAQKTGIIPLAIKLSIVHKERAGAELAARIDLIKEQADRIIAAFPKPKDEIATIGNWSSTAARKWLMSYARSLSSEAKYIRENADGFAENEEEFRCGLANGLGIDDEDEQTKIITDFMNAFWQKEK